MTQKRPKIIYICGSGRSGSTLLDIILGNQKESVSVGELNFLHRFAEGSEFCACTQTFNNCDFWPTIVTKWQELSSEKEPLETLKKYQNIFERFKTAHKGIYHYLTKSPSYKHYCHLVKTLYQAITETSGQEVIIDSSKNPLRAFYISSIKDLNFNVLHFIRDGRGVAYSLSKAYEKDVKKGIQTQMHPKPIWRTALFWMIVNLISHLVGLRYPKKYIRVFYEDFLKDAPHLLDRLSNHFSISYDEIKTNLKEEKSFKTAHNVAGNRLRMNGAIKLKKTDPWRDDFPKKSQRIFNFIAFPLLWVYGYFK